MLFEIGQAIFIRVVGGGDLRLELLEIVDAVTIGVGDIRPGAETQLIGILQTVPVGIRRVRPQSQGDFQGIVEIIPVGIRIAG